MQWSTIGQKVTIDCIYENVEPEMKLSWLKNEEPLFFDPRISFSRNETRLQIDDVTRSDTGAYTCRLSNLMENIFVQSTSSVIIQVSLTIYLVDLVLGFNHWSLYTLFFFRRNHLIFQTTMITKIVCWSSMKKD